MCAKAFTASCKSILLASSFSTAITIRSFNLLSPMVVRKYVFTLLRDEKNLSFEAVVIGSVFIIEIIFKVSLNASG